MKAEERELQTIKRLQIDARSTRRTLDEVAIEKGITQVVINLSKAKPGPLLELNYDAVSVPDSAIQTVEGKSVVFVRTKDGFEAVPVVLGDRAGANVIVRSGLKGTEQIAITNSFLTGPHRVVRVDC